MELGETKDTDPNPNQLQSWDVGPSAVIAGDENPGSLQEEEYHLRFFCQIENRHVKGLKPRLRRNNIGDRNGGALTLTPFSPAFPWSPVNPS